LATTMAPNRFEMPSKARIGAMRKSCRQLNSARL
jgi:hypothetical protein